MTFKNSVIFSVLVTTFLVIAACDSHPGPDSISSHGSLSAGALPDCALCHNIALGTRRQILGTGGDFALNTGIVSHHVTTAGADPTAAHCLVCHDIAQHGSGTVRLKNADTGAIIAYTSRANIETFCLSCHDADGATNTFITGGSALNPFNDGSVLGTPPYPYAAGIANSWSKSYGHGTNGNHSAGSRLTCMGTGQPGTGCHGNNGAINAHGSSNQVLAAQSFTYDIGGSYVESDYYLCFNCHASYPGVRKEDILGVRFGGILDNEYGWLTGPNGPNGWNPPYYTAGVITHFADHNETGSTYNDPNFWGFTDMNLHWFHLGIPASLLRGTSATSGIICVNCHDVHGSLTPYGAVYDEIGYTHVFPDATNILGKMTDAAYTTNLLDFHPTYCGGFNCHPPQGPSRAWYYPITE